MGDIVIQEVVHEAVMELLDKLFVFDEYAFYLQLFGVRIWNKVMAWTFQLLGMDLEEFAGGSGLDIVQSISTAFTGVAAILFVLFFIYNIYHESFEEQRKELNFWGVIRLFLPLALGEVLITNSAAVVTQIFRMGFALVQMVTKSDLGNLMIDEMVIAQAYESFKNSADGINLIRDLILFLVSLICMIVMVICAGILLYIVYYRYLKLYCIIPFSSLAFSTVIGPQELKRIGMMYGKYVCVLALESVAILIMIVLCNAVLSGGIPELEALMENDFMLMLLRNITMMFTCCLTVGSAKGSEVLLEKWLLH